jgi:flagellar motor switch protein FliN/FliY
VKWAPASEQGQGAERAMLTMTLGEVSGTLWIDIAAEQPAGIERPPEALLELELPFALRLASVEMELSKLQELDTGALIPLGRSADGDINLVVGGRVIARGQLVVVDGCFGIQIDSVETAERRLKTLGRV